MFRKAEKKKTKLRLAISGVSGSGKTVGALTIAKALSDKVAVINTETGSGDIYSGKFQYDVCDIITPFTPERYIQAIKGADKEGYEVIIIDSLSHEWSGEGGVLEMVDLAAKATSSKNSYSAWKDITPRHNRLVETILQSKAHIIVTLREKAAYEMQQNDRGKMVPIKLGLAPVQREGLEYEFTTWFNLSIDGHIATASKDRTGLFDGRHFVIDETTGADLLKWLEDGKQEEPIPGADFMVGEIQACETLDSLKDCYLKYKPLLSGADLKRFADEKDKRKAELEAIAQPDQFMRELGTAA